MDIDLYNNPENYDTLQMSRPDYRLAIEKEVSFAKDFLVTRQDAKILDLCSGTGLVGRKACESISAEVNLVDENPKLQEIAEKMDWGTCKVQTQCVDVLRAVLPGAHFDLVISSFAYHHLPDSDKKEFLKMAHRALKSDGRVVIAEIYIPNRVLIQKYYLHLIDSVPEHQRTQELKDFLTQTAKSEDYEYKVSRDFAQRQFDEVGFEVVYEERIWSYSEDQNVGTFVQVLKKV